MAVRFVEIWLLQFPLPKQTKSTLLLWQTMPLDCKSVQLTFDPAFRACGGRAMSILSAQRTQSTSSDRVENSPSLGQTRTLTIRMRLVRNTACKRYRRRRIAWRLTFYRGHSTVGRRNLKLRTGFSKAQEVSSTTVHLQLKLGRRWPWLQRVLK